MLDFENLDGFVVDLSNKETAKEAFECVYTYEENETYDNFDIEEIREMVVEYYSHFDLLIVRRPNVYFVCECELEVK